MIPKIASRPLITVLLAYGAGIMTGPLAASLTLGSAAMLAFSCGIVAISVVFFLKHRIRSAFALLICLFFTAGLCWMQAKITPGPQRSTISRYIDTGPVTVEAVVTEPPVDTLHRTRLKLSACFVHSRVAAVPVTGNLQLSLKQAGSRLAYGDRIQFQSALHRPQNFQNPGGFDYVRQLALSDIYVTAFLDSDDSVTRLGGGEGSWLLLKTDILRSRIRSCIHDTLQPPSRDVLLALIIGEQGTIPDEVRTRFSALGITHILSISGLHVSIFALITFWILFSTLKLYPRLLLYLPAKKIGVFLSIFPVLAYCLIAGLSTPAVRSGLMVVCYLLTLLLDRPQHMLHTLLAAALAILAVSPQSLFEISFELSFLAVFCLIVLTPAWKSSLPKKEPDPLKPNSPLRKKAGNYIIDSLMSSGAAMLGTAPLVAWYFYTFAPAGFLTNLVMVPYAGFILVPVGLAAAFISSFWPQAAPALIGIAGLLTDFFLYLSELLYRVLGDGITVARPLLWEIAGFYLLLFASALCRTKRHWCALLLGCCLFIGAEISQSTYAHRPDGILRVTFLDVGSGDAAVLQLPNKEVLMIDGGGLMDDSFDIGRAVVAPFLYTCGIKEVPFIVMTHPHSDHAGGLPYIAKHFNMREFWHNGSSLHTDSFDSLLGIARDRQALVQPCTASLPKRILGPVEIAFFNPRSEGTASAEKANDDSLVMKITYGKVSFLFTADISSLTESELAATGADIAATVLKVPHHGSQTSCSSDLLNAVNPSIAVISCRSSGRHRLPHPLVQKRLDSSRITSLSTEQFGAITITTDGSELSVSTYLQDQKL